jgi:hypothetical protein
MHRISHRDGPYSKGDEAILRASSVRKYTNTACELLLRDIFFLFLSSGESRGTGAARGLAGAGGVTAVARGHHGLIKVDTESYACAAEMACRRVPGAPSAHGRGSSAACGRARSETRSLTSPPARPRWARLRGRQR